MRTLVTGGAGYIGSHVVRALLERGHDVAVIDNLSTGVRDFIPENVTFLDADITSTTDVSRFLRESRPDVVIHIAGFKFAGESVLYPLHTYLQNIEGTRSLLSAMLETGVTKVIFSSSSSVYGDAQTSVIVEDHPKKPMSPYGESKLVGEWMLNSLAVSNGFSVCSLRYFNVVGSGYGDLYDTSPHGLFSKVFAAISRDEKPVIYGDDYATPDGTCIRDYIPVGELAKAHLVAAEKLVAGQELLPAYNLGTGTGHSVAEVMRVMRDVTGIEFEAEVVGRRAGDPPMVVASGKLAARDLGWNTHSDLRDMVTTAWDAFRRSHREA